MHGGQGYVCPISLPAYQAAEKGFEIAFGKKPLAVRRGGSIPIISTFEQVLGIKTVLMGFGLESDAIHSPNLFWIDLHKVDFSPNASIKKLSLTHGEVYAGDVVKDFKDSRSFTFMFELPQ